MSRTKSTARLNLDQLGDRIVPALVVPQLNSLPGAAASLYLDFDGHYQASWGANGATQYAPGQTPAFDLDGDRTTFSAREQDAITEIWRRVAEDFAPFKLNVTTVQPAVLANNPGGGDATNYKAVRVVVGGTSGDIASWLGEPVGGVALYASFADYWGAENVAYVPANGASDEAIPQIATTVSHEAGHTFGLGERYGYNPNGPWNTTQKLPIMDYDRAAPRNIWWNDSYGNDMATIASTKANPANLGFTYYNGFGYRTDDHGNAASAATVLKIASGQTSVSANGVISKTSDQDWFAVQTAGGRVTFQVSLPASVARYQPQQRFREVGNLDVRLELRNLSNQVVKVVNPKNVTSTTDPVASLNHGLGAKIVVDNLAAGKYYVVVKSNGSYGDVGQYTLKATFTPAGISVGSTTTTSTTRGQTLTAAAPDSPSEFSTISGSGVIPNGVDDIMLNPLAGYGGVAVDADADIANGKKAKGDRLGHLSASFEYGPGGKVGFVEDGTGDPLKKVGRG